MTTKRMSDGKYLPKFFRDFHVQKQVFKYIDLVRQQRKTEQEDPNNVPDIRWIDAHIYVVDYFLWIMAQHGYTLQKTRPVPEDCGSWDTAFDAVRERETAALKQMQQMFEHGESK